MSTKILQILVIILFLTVFANAQKAILSGTVYDANGAVIPKIRIVAINEKGEKFESVTDDDGDYSLNLFYKVFDDKSSAGFKAIRYEIVVDSESRGFEKFVLKDFKFVPATNEKMNLDIALDSRNLESCGYALVDCDLLLLPETPMLRPKINIQRKVSKRPLEQLPKKNNKRKV